MDKQAEKGKWKDCGYISLSKSGKALSIVVKHERYIANLDEAAQVFLRARKYALILEYVGSANEGKEMIPFKNLPKHRIAKICPMCGSDKVSKYIFPYPNGAKDSKKLECDECGKVFSEDRAEFVLMELKEG